MAGDRKQRPSTLPEPIPGAAFVSYPKSGRTWARVMLDALGVGLEYTHDRSHYHLGIHDEPPRSDKSEFAGKRVVLMTRDPRDVIVSAYFHATRRDRTWRGSLSDFVRDARFGLESVVAFHEQWLDARDVPAALHVLRYEDMSANALVEVIKVAGFLEPLPEGIAPEAVREAERRGSFAYLHGWERRGWRGRPRWLRDYGRMLLAGDEKDPYSFKVRRGVVGGFVDHMSAGDLEYCGKVMARCAPYWEKQVWLT